MSAGFAFQDQIILSELVGEFFDVESAVHSRTLARIDCEYLRDNSSSIFGKPELYDKIQSGCKFRRYHGLLAGIDGAGAAQLSLDHHWLIENTGTVNDRGNPASELDHSPSRPSANDTAAPACCIFATVKRAMRAPMLLLGTVWRLSKFAAQVFGNPSSAVNTTSVGMLRIVEVMGATVTECSTAMAESRERIKTGRFLSGALNVYQHTSPRFTQRPSPVH
jgi:hypothetical protein